MKNLNTIALFSICFLLPYSVIAANFDEYYGQALEALNSQQNKKAVILLKKAAAARPSSTDVLYLLTSTAYQLGDFTTTIEAGSAYRKITYNSDVSFLLAQAYEQTGDKNSARKVYKDIAARAGDPYQKSARQSIELLDAPAITFDNLYYRPKSWNGVIIVGRESDSNIATSPVPGRTVGADIADDRLALAYTVNYDWNIGKRYYAGLGFFGVNQVHDDDGKNFDLGVYKLDVHGGVVGKNWRVQGNLEYEYVAFDYKKNTISHRVVLKLDHNVTKRYLYMLKASISDDEFPQSRADNAKSYTVEWFNTIKTNELLKGSYINLGYTYTNNDTDRRSTAAYEENSASIGFHVEMPWKTYMDLSSTYSDRAYDVPAPTNRSDWVHYKSITVGKRWTNSISTEISFRRNVTSSTVNRFDKIQEIIGVNMIYGY